MSSSSLEDFFSSAVAASNEIKLKNNTAASESFSKRRHRCGVKDNDDDDEDEDASADEISLFSKERVEETDEKVKMTDSATNSSPARASHRVSFAKDAASPPSTPNNYMRRFRSRSHSPTSQHRACALGPVGASPSVEAKEEAIAMWTYEPRRADELAFSKGDLIVQLPPPVAADPGWGIGYVSTDPSTTGLVPLNYLKRAVRPLGMKGSKTPSPARVSRSRRKSSRSSLSTHRFEQRFLRYGKMSGSATDTIFVVAPDGKCFSTDVNCRFKGPSGSGSKHEGDPVEVYIDGTFRFAMRMGVKGVVAFEGGSKLVPPELLNAQKIPELFQPGEHSVTFEHYLHGADDPLRFVKASFWVWSRDDSLIVSDIDGTITKSDIQGLVRTVAKGKLGMRPDGYAHKGICKLFGHIVSKVQCHVLYLTARTVKLANETRTYLLTLNQEGDNPLPRGPLITTPDGYMKTLRREIIKRNPDEFKAQVLAGIQHCFQRAGRDILKYPPILAGFGNKKTDLRAYRAAGIPEQTSFIVDTGSRIQNACGEQFVSYCDIGMYDWLVEHMQMQLDGHLPMQVDV